MDTDPASTDSELEQRDHDRTWRNYDLRVYRHLDRFGGRYRFVLAGIYRVVRQLVIVLLGHDTVSLMPCESGMIYPTNQLMFQTVIESHPEIAPQLELLCDLEPFYLQAYCSRSDVELPFDPIAGDDDDDGGKLWHKVVAYRDAAISVLEYVRSSTVTST